MKRSSSVIPKSDTEEKMYKRVWWRRERAHPHDTLTMHNCNVTLMWTLTGTLKLYISSHMLRDCDKLMTNVMQSQFKYATNGRELNSGLKVLSSYLEETNAWCDTK